MAESLDSILDESYGGSSNASLDSILNQVYEPKKASLLKSIRAAITETIPFIGEGAASEILGGEKSPRRDVVLMNAAAALVASGKAEHLREGAVTAGESIDSGRAAEKLDALIRFTAR